LKQKILLLVLLSLFVIPICGINGVTNNNSNELSPNAMIPFEKWSYVDTSDFSDPPCIADIDNDGDKEILGCIGGTQALRCYNHLGQLVWGKTYGTGLTSPVAANLVSDENLEIILGVYDTIYCEAYDGQTTYWTYLADSNIYAAPTIADLQNDSNLEVIFTTTGGSVYCLNNLGDLMWSYTISGHSFYTSPVVFDIDKDGSLEILLSPHHGEYIYCLYNNGTLKWQGYVSDGGGKRLGVADLEGDGSYEIITVQEGLLICFNHTGGLMYNRTVPPDTLHPPVFADLYNNGTLEVLIFRGIDTLSCYSSNLYLIWSVYCPAYLYKYAISDIDDNGFIDIIYGRSDYIVCLDYTGAEQWSFPLEGTNAEPHYPVISDIDNDNFADIIYSHYIPTGQLSSVRCISFSGIVRSSKQQWCTDRGSVFHTGFLDSDGDYLDDLTEEYLQTNKFDEDTDEDNIDDGIEFLSYHTNPTSSDTDADGLFDGDEVLIYNTDPLLNDTDGDGYLDGVEVDAGSDPLNKFSFP